ncbi:MAG: four helix bundle protein [Dehalococcoidia bacterium]
MDRIERFEDIIAWQKARSLTRDVYEATRQGTFSRDPALVSQVRRSAVSIMANIAEGFERNRSTEFHQFLSVAKASCAELRSHFYVALDAGHLPRPEFDALMASAEELARVIGGLRAAVARNRP